MLTEAGARSRSSIVNQVQPNPSRKPEPCTHPHPHPSLSPIQNLPPARFPATPPPPPLAAGAPARASPARHPATLPCTSSPQQKSISFAPAVTTGTTPTSPHAHCAHRPSAVDHRPPSPLATVVSSSQTSAPPAAPVPHPS